jgi:para-aminobenzoate synthetase component 1
VSSEIGGKLPENWQETLGNLLFALLPAGSVSGAPKAKTLEIIREAEGEPRGYYTGVFGVFNGTGLDSSVMIRFIEQTGTGLRYRSGGGITHLSQAPNEYNELLQKIYLPISHE